MTEDETKIIICTNCEMQDEPVIGSMQMEAGCGHLVWVAPTSLELMEEDWENIDTVCGQCVMSKFDVFSKVRKSLQEHGIQLASGALEEIRENVPEEDVEEFLAKNRVTERN